KDCTDGEQATDHEPRSWHALAGAPVAKTLAGPAPPVPPVFKWPGTAAQVRSESVFKCSGIGVQVRPENAADAHSRDVRGRHRRDEGAAQQARGAATRTRAAANERFLRVGKDGGASSDGPQPRSNRAGLRCKSRARTTSRAPRRASPTRQHALGASV